MNISGNAEVLDLVIDKRQRDLGGFEVGRVLPFAKRRMVGPFIFLDHMGPVEFAPGLARSADVSSADTPRCSASQVIARYRSPVSQNR